MGGCSEIRPAASSRSRRRPSSSSCPAWTRGSTARSSSSTPAPDGSSSPAWARAGSSPRRSRPPSPPPARRRCSCIRRRRIHGDLGRIVKGDVVLAISYSGDTEEILALVPQVKRLGVAAGRGHRQPALRPGRRRPTCTSTSRSARRPARSASRPPPPPPRRWPWATRSRWPSSSGAASPSRTSRSCTPGAASARSCCASRTSCTRATGVPRVAPDTAMKDVLFEMTRKRLGMTTVVDAEGRLLGIISDGDLRRQMERHGYTLLDQHRGRVHDAGPGAHRPARAGHARPRRHGGAQDHRPSW